MKKKVIKEEAKPKERIEYGEEVRGWERGPVGVRGDHGT